MREYAASETISTLRRMTPARAEAFLCAMRAPEWLAVGDALGAELPDDDDDKPEAIARLLFVREG